MNIPEGLLYTSDHEWVRVEGNIVTMGITDYAQDALGDVVYIQLPQVGAQVAEHNAFCEIESTKSVNDVYAPVGGTVQSVNDALQKSPELLNSDPYGEGWICVMESDNIDVASLLTHDQYRELLGV